MYASQLTEVLRCRGYGQREASFPATWAFWSSHTWLLRVFPLLFIALLLKVRARPWQFLCLMFLSAWLIGRLKLLYHAAFLHAPLRTHSPGNQPVVRSQRELMHLQVQRPQLPLPAVGSIHGGFCLPLQTWKVHKSLGFSNLFAVGCKQRDTYAFFHLARLTTWVPPFAV